MKGFIAAIIFTVVTGLISQGIADKIKGYFNNKKEKDEFI